VSVVKINAIEVPEGMGSALEERFAKRAGEVERMPGFQGFELLRPVSGETRYFVYTRWESEAAFEAWVNSSEFVKGHAQAGGGPGSRPIAQHSSLLAFEVVQRVERTD
jgi:heme oxygenase (mycobilin-producing)